MQEKTVYKMQNLKVSVRDIKKIFVSTLVYEKEKIEIPESEKIIFEFDTRKRW